MSVTDYLGNGIGSLYYHKKSLAEGGYNYYSYIHRSGKVLIMREEIATGDAEYADGEFNFSTAWTGRAGLDYKNIDEL